jgi:plasmid stabilization system protein ParE
MAARRVIWRPVARAELREIKAHIAASSPSGERRVVERMREAASNCSDFPYAARMIPEFQDPERRETIVYEYRVMSRVEPSCIRILRVVHGRRLLSNVPGSFEEPPQEEYVAA